MPALAERRWLSFGLLTIAWAARWAFAAVVGRGRAPAYVCSSETPRIDRVDHKGYSRRDNMLGSVTFQPLNYGSSTAHAQVYRGAWVSWGRAYLRAG